ncbi:MAG: carboxypeptidase-like regulatory domain-containing protein [Bacteroidota bacterium]
MCLSFKAIFFILFIAFPLGISAQFTDPQAYVKGYLYDADKKEPIPFATVKVKGWSKGVVSNRNGSFRIPKTFATLNDTLVVSSMGYHSKEVLLGQMMTKELNVIFLEPHVYGLEETVVYGKRKRKLSARAIAKKAIRAIPENYPNYPFSLLGYYRDYQWHKNDYLNLNEAILSIYDQGFESKDGQSTAFALHTIMMNESFPRDTLSSKPYDYEQWSKTIDRAHLDAYGGNELRILRIHDAIRNYEVSSYSFVYTLKSQFLNRHRFERKRDIFFNDEPLYNITFTKSQNGYAAYGHLFIDKENFSIYKLHYSLFFTDTYGKSDTSSDGPKRELIFEVVNEYRPFQDQMYLNYITFNNSFRLPEPPRFFAEELVVEIDKQQLRLKFNNPVDEQKASSISNYKLEFFGKPLPLKKAVMDTSDPTSVLLLPKFTNERAKIDFYDYFQRNRGNKKAGKELFCQLSSITDTVGNLVNKIYDYREYRQFREFFTQEVLQDFERPAPAFLMNKNIPVFEGQPALERDDIKNYWMNTPLKVIDN